MIEKYTKILQWGLCFNQTHNSIIVYHNVTASVQLHYLTIESIYLNTKALIQKYFASTK